MSDQNDLYSTNPGRIVMYTTEWCPDCRRAKFFFKRKSIDVLNVDVEADKEAEAFVKQLNHGNRSVPTIIYPDGTIMVEPSGSELEAKFSEIRIPGEAPLPPAGPAPRGETARG